VNREPVLLQRRNKMSPKPWKVISSRRDKSYRVFSLRTDRAVSPRTGQDHDFFILESSSWVNIIPDVTLEIPGGLVEHNDNAEKAARRELFEETGYRASEMFLLGSVHPNPAIQNNLCYTFLAIHSPRSPT